MEGKVEVKAEFSARAHGQIRGNLPFRGRGTLGAGVQRQIKSLASKGGACGLVVDAVAVEGVSKLRS